MTPLGHRILVKPDLPPEQTASGLILPVDRDEVPVSGTVVALGPGGARSRYQARQRAIQACLDVITCQASHEAALALLGTADPVRELSEGDRVVFPAECGLTVHEDGETYIILNEDDVAAVAAEDTA